MKPLYDSMLDTNLLGRTFAGPTFAAWRKVAKILDAAPLNQDAHALHRELTGRDSAPREAFREAYLIKPQPSRRDAVSRSLGASSTTRRRSCELFRARPSRGHPLSPGDRQQFERVLIDCSPRGGSAPPRRRDVYRRFTGDLRRDRERLAGSGSPQGRTRRELLPRVTVYVVDADGVPVCRALTTR